MVGSRGRGNVVRGRGWWVGVVGVLLWWGSRGRGHGD